MLLVILGAGASHDSYGSAPPGAAPGNSEVLRPHLQKISLPNSQTSERPHAPSPSAQVGLATCAECCGSAATAKSKFSPLKRYLPTSGPHLIPICRSGPERALPTLGVAIDSLDSYVADPAYKLVKPHGSLNWSHQIATQGITDLANQPEAIAAWLIAHAPEVAPAPQFSFSKEAIFALRPNTNPPDVLWPAIALPVAGKAEFECPEPHMNALDACIPKVSKLLTIGWRGAEQHFLKRLVGKIPVVSALVVGRDRNDAGEIVATLNGAGRSGRINPAEGGFTESLRKEIPAFLAEP